MARQRLASSSAPATKSNFTINKLEKLLLVCRLHNIYDISSPHWIDFVGKNENLSSLFHIAAHFVAANRYNEWIYCRIECPTKIYLSCELWQVWRNCLCLRNALAMNNLNNCIVCCGCYSQLVAFGAPCINVAFHRMHKIAWKLNSSSAFSGESTNGNCTPFSQRT